MKILWALFADEIIELDHEQYDIKGVRHSIANESYPVTRQVNLIVQLRADTEDYGHDNSILVTVMAPRGNSMDKWNVVVAFDLPQNHEDYSKLIQIVAPITMTFDAPGRYLVHLGFRGKTVWELPLEANVI
jgi:hypothetical protein